MKTHFHMKGYAPRLALKKRYKTTRKWPIASPDIVERQPVVPYKVGTGWAREQSLEAPRI